jgi:hypothetical protein
MTFHKCSILRPGSLVSKGIQTRLVLAARLDHLRN